MRHINAQVCAGIITCDPAGVTSPGSCSGMILCNTAKVCAEPSVVHMCTCVPITYYTSDCATEEVQVLLALNRKLCFVVKTSTAHAWRAGSPEAQPVKGGLLNCPLDTPKPVDQVCL